MGDIALSTSTGGSAWCTPEIAEDSLQISVADNPNARPRTTVVTLLTQQGQRQDITITQKAFGLSSDVEMAVSRVTATSFEPGYEPETLVDGNSATYFNSQFGAITQWPFKLDFFFEEATRVDYITILPRQDSGNGWGALGRVAIYAATASNSKLTKVDSVDLGLKTKALAKITLKTPITKPTQIEFRIYSGLQDRVSAAEVKFYQASSTFDFRKIFTDGSCSEIKPELTEADLQKITDGYYKRLALAIFNGTYDRKWRIQDYRPYTHPDMMAAVNKTSKYDLKDNATGMFVETPGEELIVFVANKDGQQLHLNIRDYQTNKEETFSLEDGLNRITPSIRGLMYIYNHTNEYIPLYDEDADPAKLAAKTVRVHFASGAVNGYFDVRKHTEADWKEILANAKYTEIDVLGKDGHVVWPVEVYRQNNTEMPLQINMIDMLIRQQKEFMGLYYYEGRSKKPNSTTPSDHRLATNRMFMHIDYAAGAGYSSDYRTGYNTGYNNVFATVDGFKKRLWVLGHELGHSNQVRPGVKFAGCTEVTNNIYAMYNQQQILGEANRLDVDGVNDDDTYETGRTLIIEDKNAAWVLPGDNYGRLITKMAPFWQLKLYLVDIMKQEHFYHDLFEHFRTTADLSSIQLAEKYYGALQLDFVRQVCWTAKMDLTEFFTMWGFLRPVKATINDYGSKYLEITDQDIQKLVSDIKAWNYPEPEFDVTTLTDQNYREHIK
ncbi:MAG: M60 family metallopeptidase [Mediterranea sp.]|nr:M60 family metallopeptidase [Mediterranea sp.]